VLLFSAFTGTATYLYGINDASKLQLPWMKATGPQYATKKEMEKAIDELRAALGEDTISTDDEDLHRHGYSEWSSINIDQLPVAVAYPKSTEEVSHLAQVCHKYKIPMSTIEQHL
jgi:D-lactate dehydrogenase (cytochrome)